MQPTAILWPVFALVAITAAVWLTMFLTRTRAMRERRVHPQKVPTRAAAAQLIGDVSAPADNFQNLFELPVLFYALAILLLQTNHAGSGFVAAAWLFVLLRGLHSFIHCTYNKVMHRFYAYAASSLVLFGMWAAFAASLLG